MVRRKSNPFAEKQRRLPHRAYIKREGPWRDIDHKEIETVSLDIANGADYLIWSGSRGVEFGCTVIGFDTAKKAAEMQVWIDTGDIAERPPPASIPGYPRLKCG